ncbi:MAG: YceI family protein [bacterium]|nr:YceI family protein [bacterium]
MRTTTRILLALVLVLAALPATAAERFTVDPAGGSRIVFTSKAPLESFDGHTAAVSGWLEFDPADLRIPPRFEIAVDLASFDTGLRKRNEHMRENHFETATYPQAWFRGGRLDGATVAGLAPGASAVVQLGGELDLHGVVQPLACEARLTRATDGRLTVEAAFAVKLSDHAIDRPKFLVMKLADEQQVKVTLVLRPEAQP